MPAQPAGGERRDHFRRQWIGSGAKEIAPVDAELHRNAVLFKIGALEVQPHAIGEAQLADAQGGIASVADDSPRRAEIGIAKCGIGEAAFAGQREARGLVPGGADRGLRAFRRAAPLKAQ